MKPEMAARRSKIVLNRTLETGSATRIRPAAPEGGGGVSPFWKYDLGPLEDDPLGSGGMSPFWKLVLGGTA